MYKIAGEKFDPQKHLSAAERLSAHGNARIRASLDAAFHHKNVGMFIFGALQATLGDTAVTFDDIVNWVPDTLRGKPNTSVEDRNRRLRKGYRHYLKIEDRKAADNKYGRVPIEQHYYR